MKYFNIKLLGKNNLYFVKYTDGNKVEMDKLSSLDTSLSKSIINPDISSYGYMIFHGMYNSVGMIKIRMDKDLIISLSLDRNNLTEELISTFTNDIIESLCRLCPFYKYLVINGIRVENKFNTLNDLIIEELGTFKGKLADSNISYNEIYQNNNYVDYEPSNKNTKPGLVRRDLFIETDKLSLTDIISNHNTSNISFTYDGNVSFETLGKNKDKYYSLQVEYNVDQSFLRLYCVRNSRGSNTNILEMVETENKIEYSIGKTKVEYDKETESNNYKYSIIFDEYRGLDFDLLVDNNDNVEHCYLDLNIKKKNKVKGTYMIRIKDNKMIVYYSHRKGDKEQLLSLSFNNNISYPDLEILIRRAFMLISKTQEIDTSFINFDELLNLRTEVNKYAKEINGRIPLPILNKMLSKYDMVLDKQKVKRNF